MFNAILSASFFNENGGRDFSTQLQCFIILGHLRASTKKITEAMNMVVKNIIVSEKEGDIEMFSDGVTYQSYQSSRRL